MWTVALRSPRSKSAGTCHSTITTLSTITPVQRHSSTRVAARSGRAQPALASALTVRLRAAGGSAYRSGSHGAPSTTSAGAKNISRTCWNIWM